MGERKERGNVGVGGTERERRGKEGGESVRRKGSLSHNEERCAGLLQRRSKLAVLETAAFHVRTRAILQY